MITAKALNTLMWFMYGSKANDLEFAELMVSLGDFELNAVGFACGFGAGK